MIKSVNTNNTEGVEVNSVDYELNSEVSERINNVLETIKTNPLIKSCSINGAPVWRTVKQYSEVIENGNRNEIPKHDTFEFRSDVQEIIIKPFGEITFKAYNKLDASAYITFNIIN